MMLLFQVDERSFFRLEQAMQPAFQGSGFRVIIRSESETAWKNILFTKRRKPGQSQPGFPTKSTNNNSLQPLIFKLWIAFSALIVVKIYKTQFEIKAICIFNDINHFRNHFVGNIT